LWRFYLWRIRELWCSKGMTISNLIVMLYNGNINLKL
jgi:hypothetical protein